MSTTNHPSDSLPAGTPDIVRNPATGFPAAIAEALAPAVSVTMNEDIQRKYTAAKVSRFAKKAFGTLCKK